MNGTIGGIEMLLATAAMALFKRRQCATARAAASLQSPDRRDAEKQSHAHRQRQSHRIMRMVGEKFMDDLQKWFSFAIRPRHAQRPRHKPRLQHQPDVHERDVREVSDRAKVRVARLPSA